jgi:hypothetical protein
MKKLIFCLIVLFYSSALPQAGISKIYATDLESGNGVFVNFQFVLVADDTAGLKIYDLRPINPFPLTLLSNYKHPSGSAQKVFVEGNYAYVAYGSAGLIILDISNPSAPSLVSSLNIGNAFHVYVEGQYEYLIVSDSLKIVNVSNPATPVFTGVYKPAPIAYPQGIFVKDGSVFLAENGADGGLEHINATNPANPVKVNLYTYQGFTYDVAYENDLLYVGEGPRIHKYVITSPASPVYAWTDTVGGKASAIDANQDLIFAKDGQQLKVYYRAGLLYSHDMMSFIYDVAANMEYVFVSGDSLTVFRYMLADIDDNEKSIPSFTLEQNYPNPFNPITTIKYQLPVSGYVTLKVFDILGNEVAILVNEPKEPGYHEVIFDASRLTSGVYIYSLNHNEFVSAKKLLIIK